MIDMSNISRDFTPRRRRPEEEFAPQAPGQAMPPPSGGMPVGGGGASTGQPQPFAPGGIDPTQPQPFGGGGTPVSPTPGWTEWGAPVGGWEKWLEEHPEGLGGQPVGGGQMPPSGGMPQAGTTPTDPATGRPLFETQMQQPPGAGTPEAGGFPYPEQWGAAEDIYGQLAGGMPGMPDPGAIWGGYQQQAGDLSRELAEQAGMGMGGRYGSALQRNIADVGMRAGERFGGEMERLRMGDIAGQRQAMLGAAGGLSGLGGAQAMLPGQLAGQAMGLGGQYQQMQNIPLQAEYQEFMRTQPEYSPYLPYMQQGAQVPYGPQTYQPGFGSSMMDIGSQVAMYGMMNPRGQEQSWLTRPW